jgi:spoIIIJ-associated protein
MLDDPGGDAPAEDAGPVPAATTGELEQLTDRILGGLGLDVRSKATDTDAALVVDLTGSDRDYLLSRKGEGLSALQYLLNRILYKGRKGKKIQVDCGGFRKLREDEIVEIALLTAEKAKACGEECLLAPMNSYERRLVHLALAEIAGVETRSVGDGFLKRIAIVPVAKAGTAGDPDDRP